MTEDEQINAISIFIAALIVTTGYNPVLFDTLKFGELVANLPDNLFSKLFPVTRTVVGPRCRDFREGICLAQDMDLLIRNVSTPPTIIPKMNLFQVINFEKDTELFEDAKKFVSLYLD